MQQLNIVSTNFGSGTTGIPETLVPQFNGVPSTIPLNFVNAVQSLTVGGVNGGTVDLTYNGQASTASSLVVNAGALPTANDVQNYLRAIPVLSGNEVQTLTLVANGTTTLLFNGVNAGSAP